MSVARAAWNQVSICFSLDTRVPVAINSYAFPTNSKIGVYHAFSKIHKQIELNKEQSVQSTIYRNNKSLRFIIGIQ